MRASLARAGLPLCGRASPIAARAKSFGLTPRRGILDVGVTSLSSAALGLVTEWVTVGDVNPRHVVGARLFLEGVSEFVDRGCDAWRARRPWSDRAGRTRGRARGRTVAQARIDRSVARTGAPSSEPARVRTSREQRRSQNQSQAGSNGHAGRDVSPRLVTQRGIRETGAGPEADP